MDTIADKKVHFAPFDRQQREIRRLLREGRYRNVSHFMRSAIDHYLERLGRPSLLEQARQMSEDYREAVTAREVDASWLQEPSRDSGEDW